MAAKSTVQSHHCRKQAIFKNKKKKKEDPRKVVFLPLELLEKSQKNRKS